MKFKAVIGLGFGDEGKGITTDYLCMNSIKPIVVRFSGGPQAGHTVIHNGIRHVFSHFGSGTLQGVPTFWSRFCTVNPISFLNELEVLRDKGISPSIFIDEKCPITTPYDIQANRKSSETIAHGSCGVGFGATIQREENKYSLLFEDLFNSTVFNIKMNLIRDYYGMMLNETEFRRSVDAMLKESSVHYDVNLFDYVDVIFEGSQGLLLDQDIGFFPNVTRSNTGMKNIHTILKEKMNVVPDIETYLVTRAYQTRHGNGYMTNEEIRDEIIPNVNETNVSNTYQGNFRRSLLDLDLLTYSINKDPILQHTDNNIVVTCLDQMVNDCRLTENGEIKSFDSPLELAQEISLALHGQNLLCIDTDETCKIRSFHGYKARCGVM
jgi:adenylosuccinate synthase